jgi:hypothetical protein
MQKEENTGEGRAAEADVAQKPADRDPRISEIFYRLAEFTDTQSGRTMGRKIGVIQEIVCRKLLMQSKKLVDSIMFEPWLRGASGADHKVEFVFFQPILALNLRLGETKSTNGLNLTLARVTEDRATLKLRRDGKAVGVTLRLHTIVKGGNALKLVGADHAAIKLSAVVPAQKEPIIVEKNLPKIKLRNLSEARIVFLDTKDVRASVESKRVGAQRFSSSDKLGSGIQTIEKAKQTSLVAVDADLKFNGTIKALADPNRPRRYISLVVLGNGVHWTEKDKAILETYVDFAFLARDASIIRYLDYVRDKAVDANANYKDFLMGYFQGMTKTPPDDFAVSANDFEIISPAADERSMNEILETHIDDYREI